MRQLIRREVKRLSHQAWDHIWFPKNTLEGYLFRYGSASLLALLLILYLVAFPSVEAKAGAYTLSLVSIFVAAILGNLQAGILLTVFTVISLIVFYPAGKELFPYYGLEISPLLLSGFLVSWVIHRMKRVDIGREFARREKRYQEAVEKLHEEKLHAEKEIRVREEFISIASHELKTPLTSTLLKLEAALHNIQHVSLAKFSVQNLLQMLESAELQTKRLGRMINDLLNVSIIRTGRLELVREQCDLAEITKEVLIRFSERAEKEGVKIHAELTPDTTGFWDKIRMEQVISNLVSNALKYGSGKPIDVRLSKRGKMVYLSIRDHGIGIPKDQMEIIFNLFERVTGNGHYRGLGIGLYISNQIVKAHQGKITVQSKPGKGSEFTIELPTSPNQAK